MLSSIAPSVAQSKYIYHSGFHSWNKFVFTPIRTMAIVREWSKDEVFVAATGHIGSLIDV